MGQRQGEQKHGAQKHGAQRHMTKPAPARAATGPYVMGRNTVQEVLAARPEIVREIYIADGGARRDQIAQLAESVGLPLQARSRDQLTSLLGSDSHQGVAALIKDRSYQELKGWLKKAGEAPGLFLALDSIEDPHNFGALLRAAECAGVSGVLWARSRGSDITPVVTKAAVGASELVPLFAVGNLAQALEDLKEAGYWIVVADGSEGSEDLYSFKFPERSVIVVGAEGEGVHDLILRRSDFKVRIPMKGRISSLNVSQAAAVFLSHYNLAHVGKRS